jgi:hypothetical protein
LILSAASNAPTASSGRPAAKQGVAANDLGERVVGMRGDQRREIGERPAASPRWEPDLRQHDAPSRSDASAASASAACARHLVHLAGSSSTVAISACARVLGGLERERAEVLVPGARKLSDEARARPARAGVGAPRVRATALSRNLRRLVRLSRLEQELGLRARPRRRGAERLHVAEPEVPDDPLR